MSVILREIYFGVSRTSKIAVFAILRAILLSVDENVNVYV